MVTRIEGKNGGNPLGEVLAGGERGSEEGREGEEGRAESRRRTGGEPGWRPAAGTIRMPTYMAASLLTYAYIGIGGIAGKTGAPGEPARRFFCWKALDLTHLLC